MKNSEFKTFSWLVVCYMLFLFPISSTAQTLDPLLDYDGDGLTGTQESIIGTSDLDCDSDDDGIPDGDEILSYGTNPADTDTDGDGLNDGLESGVTLGCSAGVSVVDDTTTYGGTDSFWQPDFDPSSVTDPLDPDTDNDGLCDGPVHVFSLCAAGEDMNANGRVDAGEADPLDADTDDDGINDSDEESAGLDPLDNDTDADGLNDGLEVGLTTGITSGSSSPGNIPFVGTDPSSWQPDFDPSSVTDPLDPDTDNDGLCDGPVHVFSLCAAGEDMNANGRVDAGETDPSSANNHPPSANAGDNQIVFDEITLNGSQSSDPDNNPLTYSWQITHRTNSAYNRTATGVSPTLSNLQIGFYDVNLTVIDSGGLPDTDIMLFTATGPAYTVEQYNQIVVEKDQLIARLCIEYSFDQGFNLVGFSCPPEGYSAYQFLNDIGAGVVSSIQRFTKVEGVFNTAAFDLSNQPTGVDFPILPGVGYIINMLTEVPSFQP